MMQLVPTWIVKFYVADNAPQVEWRIPDTELDSVLRVLRFNGVASFKCAREDMDAS